jgi:hypothetical protein
VFDPKYGLDLSVDVSVSINGICIIFCVYMMVYHGIDETAKIRKAAGFCAAALITLCGFVFLCAKFNYFLKSGNPYTLQKTQDDVYVFVGKLYNGANVPTLKEAECPMYVNDDGSVAPTKDTSDKFCKFLTLRFSGDLLGDDMTKFSIGFGLLIYFVLMWLAFFAKIVMKEKIDETEAAADEAAEAAAEAAVEGVEVIVEQGAGREELVFRAISQAGSAFVMFIYKLLTGKALMIVPLIIQSQQFCVLMLLTNVTANDYCAHFVVPTQLHHAICLYEFGVHSLPWGIIFAVATVIAFLMGNSAVEANRGNENGCLGGIIALILLCIAGFCFVHAVGLLAYWFFAGFGVGLWFEFASMDLTWRFVVMEGLSVVALITNDVLEILAPTVSSMNCCLPILAYIAANTNDFEDPKEEFVEMNSSKKTRNIDEANDEAGEA